MTFIFWKQILFRGHDFYFVAKNLKKNLEHMSFSSHCVTLNPAQDCLFLLRKYKTFGLLGLLGGRLNKNHRNQNSHQILMKFLKLMLMKQEYLIMGYFTHYILLIGNRCMINSQVYSTFHLSELAIFVITDRYNVCSYLGLDYTYNVSS